ncbi:MAG: hypothetical protein WC080_04670 [Patescibacteria group bacterium]|jgi:hypothetical protein
MGRRVYYPPIYVCYRKGDSHYLLFWIEFGNDGSVYVWFSENHRKLFQVLASHEQEELSAKISQISVEDNPIEVYNPHISYHSSGRVHISGYDNLHDKPKEHVIEDRATESFLSVCIKKIGLPFCSIISPVMTAEKWAQLEVVSKDEFLKKKWNYSALVGGEIKIASNNNSGRTLIAIDSSSVSKNHALTTEIIIHGSGQFDFDSDPNKKIKNIIGKASFSNEKAPAKISLQFSTIPFSRKKDKRNTNYICLYNNDYHTIVLIKPTDPLQNS